VQRVVAISAVSATAEVLRSEILLRDDGDWLGSEDELLGRLGVSRPTLRQAARLLEAEELLVVRRGLNGGLFSRRPTSDAVARMASVYLRSEGTTVVDLARS
jgi:GntR family transcriptional regulator, transcriptional repressor for pyruvate dehydrogenase complex